jgi:redox-sensitive bicupin YhaK (pirin superfamily)
MEILTYVLSGTLRHRDSTGSSGDIRYGEVQVMSAGTGVQHSEVNPSPDSLLIHQDARVFTARLNGTEMLDYPVSARRKIYLHVARGSLQANGNAFSAGDALKYTDEAVVELSAAQDAEVLLFDMG